MHKYVAILSFPATRFFQPLPLMPDWRVDYMTLICRVCIINGNKTSISILGHIKKFLVSRPSKISKVMRVCGFHFYFLFYFKSNRSVDNTQKSKFSADTFFLKPCILSKKFRVEFLHEISINYCIKSFSWLFQRRNCC